MSYSTRADRRALRPDSSILPAGSDAWVDPFPPVGLKPRTPAPPAERPPAALTAREERVRRILLKELDHLNRKYGYGLNDSQYSAYQEKKRVFDRLDVAYLDRQIARMHKELARAEKVSRPMTVLMVLIGLAFPALVVTNLVQGKVFYDGIVHLLPMVSFLISPLTIKWGHNALRRKLFIYEALRALSDADEIDVILSKAAADADRLIEQITSRELEAEAHLGPANRLFSR